ncbi:transcriptional regulator, HxlR family [Desulfotomaculum arcticum]|uniref:Transcriptional regulator, HxlR family n=1 Tax=Desulfotruncus arcticus DSM 17038 TaxID=1121424 RepID=A0A1I2R9S3_9FIRM|nr:helix-turn-helix domain-containing protein [Desulfotruncus arcticus]SFG34621.1 transcriptional regulator, HxlR family [Desulfotomaculum arcticum] [Desulfotruncus arcticus DSM 17038]
MIKYRDTEYRCSMELTIDLIGGKWKSLILWNLGEDTLRFGELRKKLPQVTQKMLTQQLRELEKSGLVNRFVYTEVPPKVEYSLTPAGKSILPILASLCQWGLDYIGKTEKINVDAACQNRIDKYINSNANQE